MTDLSPQQFFAKIWPEKLLKQEFLELRIINRTDDSIQTRFFSDTDTLLQYAHQNDKDDIYFGVSTRWGQGGKKHNCFRTRTLWMDLDRCKIDEAANFLPRPDILVDSGRGVHCYWTLQTAVLMNNGAWEKVEAINRGICKTFRGDITTIDVSRVLRVPGFKNHKYTPAREVKAYAL